MLRVEESNAGMEEAWGMGKMAWGPGETPAFGREPFGLFHGVNMGHGEDGMGLGVEGIGFFPGVSMASKI
jgi:hypothetical protein